MSKPKSLAQLRRLPHLSKERFEPLAEKLRTRLLSLQGAVRDADCPVVLVLSGGDRESALDVVNRLTEWLDARLLDLHLRPGTTDAERERPYLWRWASRLPATGRIGVFPHAWAQDLLVAELGGRRTQRDPPASAERIVAFERMLVDSGALVVKIWFHLDDELLRERRKRSRNDPLRAWDPERGGDAKWKRLESDDAAEDRVLASTDHAGASRSRSTS